ncbi:hypothetical protein BpHYR1_027815 [Brachionus plicatilis]|uniref:Uncharacterized protein n=1 Tax=Brachionus plicatilis TaxID=10195 RepID=A0A3M7S490_BRAPC|nr:hypothetical protein BpHYR1_027815 [Brachionus plicatilis]
MGNIWFMFASLECELTDEVAPSESESASTLLCTPLSLDRVRLVKVCVHVQVVNVLDDVTELGRIFAHVLAQKLSGGLDQLGEVGVGRGTLFGSTRLNVQTLHVLLEDFGASLFIENSLVFKLNRPMMTACEARLASWLFGSVVKATTRFSSDLNSSFIRKSTGSIRQIISCKYLRMATFHFGLRSLLD